MTDINIGCDVIMEFIDNNNFRKDKLEKSEKSSENSLMLKFKKEIIYKNTEVWIKDNELFKGRYDLKCGNIIVDYKSSSNRVNSKQVIKKSNVDLIKKEENKEIDFQAISYIVSLINDIGEQKINFIYNYILANRNNTINPNLKPENNITNITYIPFYFTDYIVTEEFYEELKITKSKDFIEKLGFENYKIVIKNIKNDSKDYLINESINETITDALLVKSNECNISYKDFKKNKVETFIKDLIAPISEYVCKKRFVLGNTGYLYKEDFEQFVAFAKQKLDEMNQHIKNKFPAEPIFDLRSVCKKCDYLNICLENKLWN